jgi:hypothetical protein
VQSGAQLGYEMSTKSKHSDKGKLPITIHTYSLMTKLIYTTFRNSALTANKTQNFTITQINWLTLFKEIIAVYSENRAKYINTKYIFTVS